MPKYRTVTARQRDEYLQLDDRFQATQLPVFLNHDEEVLRYWELLMDCFPDSQYLLVNENDEPVGRGNSIPLRFEGDWSALPDGGFDWVLEKGFRDHEAGREPNIQSALFIVVSQDHLGAGLSYRMLDAMRSFAHRRGFKHLIAPLRPSSKSRFPLIPIEEYCRWTRSDGKPFDPWMRVHVNSGGTMLRPCSEAMVVRNTVAQWSSWTGLSFPGDGAYVVPGGLVPLFVDLRKDQGAYYEPGIWMLHETGSAVD